MASKCPIWWRMASTVRTRAIKDRVLSGSVARRPPSLLCQRVARNRSRWSLVRKRRAWNSGGAPPPFEVDENRIRTASPPRRKGAGLAVFSNGPARARDPGSHRGRTWLRRGPPPLLRSVLVPGVRLRPRIRLAFSGVTTTVTGALKEGLRGIEHELSVTPRGVRARRLEEPLPKSATDASGWPLLPPRLLTRAG